MPASPAMVGLARGWAARGMPVAAARPAATVALLRDGSGGVEVYLLRRVRGMAFAGGMHVFPGGSVDERDGADDGHWSGPLPAAWAAAFGTDEALARALVRAAVRETFEESGVLLAGPSPGTVVADVDDAGWEDDRRALLDRTSSLTGLLSRRGLVLRADLLRPWAHWVTPEFEPRRFDTAFFVAALPTGQRPRDVGGEADRVRWMRPAEAVAAARAGALAMLPPTEVTLDELSAYRSVADVLRADRTVVRLLPRLVDLDGDPHLVVAPA